MLDYFKDIDHIQKLDFCYIEKTKDDYGNRMYIFSFFFEKFEYNMIHPYGRKMFKNMQPVE